MNRTRLLAILLTVWSAVTALCAFVKTFPTLLLTRVAIGAAESGAAPTSLSILSDYFPKSQRGRAIGLFYLATPVGLALGFAIGGYLVGMVGWRNVFLIAGIPGIVFALLVLLTVREPVRGTFEPPQKGPALVSSLGTVFRVISQKKTLLLLILAAVTIIMGQAGISSFLPSLLVREYGMSLEHVGLFMALIHGVGGAIGMPAGGMLSDFVSKRSLAFAPRMVSILVFLAAPLALAGCFSPSILVTGVCFFIYSILIHTYLGPTLSTYLTLAPAELRGVMSAAILVAMNLFGTGVGPQVTGIVSDLFNHWGVDQPLRMAMLFPAACLFISAGFYMAASTTTEKDAQGIDLSDKPAPAH